MKETRRLFLMLGGLLLLGALMGCTLFYGGRNENPYLNNDYERFYVGTRGIEAGFVNLPTRLYYYGPQDNAGNAFVIGADVHNMGASFSRGGIYLSGYDPNLIAFREVPIHGGALGACGLSIGSIGFGELGGIFRCDGVEVSGGAGITNIKINSIGELVKGINERFDNKKNWLDSTKFDDTSVQFTHNPTGNNFLVNFNTAHIEYFQHGRLFIAFLAALNFMKNGGREFLLAGNTYEFPGGEGDYFEYNGRIVDWPPGLDQTTQKLLLTSCYQYTTFADPVVCIDPEPESDNYKVCRPYAKTWGGGNGAPVAITSVEQENTPRKVIFHINVRNIGTGTVYDPGQLEKCSPYYPGRTTQSDLNVVYLGDVRIGQVGLRNTGGLGGMTCYPEIIRLDPNTRSGSTTCTYPIEYAQLKSAYETPLVVELWYGYSQTQQRDIYIKRVI
jgi:hypothetical protein